MAGSPLPVCWCGDPATYALEAGDGFLVGESEVRLWWIRTGLRTVLVVGRCRPHAGPLAHEVTEGDLVVVEPVLPLDW